MKFVSRVSRVVLASSIAASCLAFGCDASTDEAPAPSDPPERAPVAGGDEPSTPTAPSSPSDPSSPAPTAPKPATDPAAGPTAFAWDEAANAPPRFSAAANDLLTKCTTAIATLAALEAPAAFVDEGKSATDPKKVASRAIWETLDRTMPTLGYCARLQNPAQAAARDAIIAYVGKLSKVYVGGVDLDPQRDDDDPGNVVNEVHIVPVVFAIDMIHAKLSGADLTAADTLLSSTAQRVAKFQAALDSLDLRRDNYWQTRALYLRAASALVRNDTAAAQDLAGKIDAHVARNLVAPADWKTPSCANLASIGAYGSTALQRSDAFNAHVPQLQRLSELVALRPGYLAKTSEAAISNAIAILQPYVGPNAKPHEEYVCTTLDYDKTQRAAGAPGFSGPWDPTTSKRMFRFARVAFPSTRPWSQSFTTTTSEWIEVFTSGKGDS